ncbi:hypothetical protein [Mesorhizobium sp. WSM1293]|uniref:hypothetical protein n=1 Tax=Mesorhizobium sp. WSM1293 TaxID=1040984 RepID=UPI0018DE65F4|nr:hypothetical protein [Mesorhizobium sp. WSM1293]
MDMPAYDVTELTPEEASSVSGGWLLPLGFAILGIAGLVIMGIFVDKILKHKS